MDGTLRTNLEVQRRESRTLVATAQLASGIAHEFSNLLTIIIGQAEMARAEPMTVDEYNGVLREILTTAEEGAGLTRQLMTFSRKNTATSEAVDLNASVRDAARLLRRLLGPDVVLNLVLAEESLTIMADHVEVAELLMNLVTNANDALPDGGTITIETSLVQVDDTVARRHSGAHGGPHVLLRVSDAGHGMDPETQSRMFEPFLPEQAGEKGAGLGLATTNDTRESLDAPVASPAPETTIMLVDDDDALRGIVRTVLRRAGYRVLESSNGIDALRLLDRTDHPVHVVVTDMVMPGMGGRDLAYEVRVRYPDARLVLMSGYSRTILPEDDPLQSDAVFLKKPFLPQVLLSAVREAITTPLTTQPNASPVTESGAPTDRGPGDARALDALLNSTAAVAWESDANTGRIHYVSRSAESLLGYPREAWHQPGFADTILHPDDRVRIQALRHRAARTREGFTAEYRVKAASGAILWLRDVVGVVPGRADAPLKLGGVLFDITEARAAMDTLRFAKESAERADAAKSQFLALVSHELQTPLNAVIGFANILRKNRGGNLEPRDITYASSIATNGEHLLAIVRDVLDLTGLEAGTLVVQSVPVALGDIVRDTVAEFQSLASQKQLDVSASIPSELADIRTDPDRMHQVLTKLIGNAIEYTDAGSVQVRLIPHEGSHAPARIEIQDTGCGIPEEKLTTVFESFAQAETFTHRRHQGAGMGLGIARGLCELMGFRLTLTSVVGGGSTCTIDLEPAS